MKPNRWNLGRAAVGVSAVVQSVTASDTTYVRREAPTGALQLKRPFASCCSAFVHAIERTLHDTHPISRPPLMELIGPPFSAFRIIRFIVAWSMMEISSIHLLSPLNLTACHTNGIRRAKHLCALRDTQKGEYAERRFR